MNVRKPVDYGTMYRELTVILAQKLSQMDEIYAIGKTISQRPEKGAAVAAAEFLRANFPDRTGFSPRNVRRMRDFYRVYENDQTFIQQALKIGWTLSILIIVLIGLMQLGTRCSDGSYQTHEYLIAGFSAIEAEAELVQVCLKLLAATMVSFQQERFQVADGFVQPVQVARFILFRVQLHARQVLIASVAVAFDFCTCRNSFADDLLKCFTRDVFHDLHPREQRSPVFRF